MNLYVCPVFTHKIQPVRAKCGKHFVLHLNTHKLFMHKTIQEYTHVQELIYIFITIYGYCSFKSYLFSCIFVSGLSMCK